MTHILSIDPGKNTGIALGFYDAITPYQLLERWQVHNGVAGLHAWWQQQHTLAGAVRANEYDLVVEKFVLADDNDFAADLTPVQVEGAIEVLNDQWYNRRIAWQERTLKGSLIGYRPATDTKTKRQRARFDFLERFGMFRAGTENDDSNDAIVHALVYLKLRRHAPSLHTFWPETLRLRASAELAWVPPTPSF